MAERIAILCVAWNKFSQSIRRLVLESEGFDVILATPENAPSILSRSSFDVVVISHDVTEAETFKIRAESEKKTRIIHLPGFILPVDLLDHIRQATQRDS